MAGDAQKKSEEDVVAQHSTFFSAHHVATPVISTPSSPWQECHSHNETEVAREEGERVETWAPRNHLHTYRHACHIIELLSLSAFTGFTSAVPTPVMEPLPARVFNATHPICHEQVREYTHT